MLTLIPTLLALAAPATVADHPVLVDVAWVAERLADPRLVVIQVGPREEYDRAHLPGSVWLNPFDDMAAPRGGPLRLELPAPDALQARLRAAGMNDDSYVVLVFSGGWITPTGRAFMTLEWAGLRGRVSLLDGGLDAWSAAGRPVTTEVPAPRAGPVPGRPDRSLVVSLPWLRDRLQDPAVAVIDARTPEFYHDTQDNRMPRGGHIPGAGNVPFNSLTLEPAHRLKPAADLAAAFAGAGATQGKRVVTYCHIGQQASWVYFVARALGYEASLFDGSFEAWSADASVPVAGDRPRNPNR